MHWKKKATIARVLSTIPLGEYFHYLLQRYLTKSLPRSKDIVSALINLARKDIDFFCKHSAQDLSSAVFLEIGAGRDLVVPIALRALGVGKVIAVDINRLANLSLVNSAAKNISDILGIEIQAFDSWDDLEAFGIEYRAPFNLSKNPLNTGIDAFVSNEVFEHIPADVIPDIISAVISNLNDGGMFIHSIDYSDHFARDCNVSRHNFLLYENAEWERHNPSMIYVNRLRHSDYKELFQQSGLRIVEEEIRITKALPESINENLARKFAQYEKSDLEILAATWLLKA